jgi:hypothetical protein
MIGVLNSDLTPFPASRATVLDSDLAPFPLSRRDLEVLCGASRNTCELPVSLARNKKGLRRTQPFTLPAKRGSV